LASVGLDVEGAARATPAGPGGPGRARQHPCRRRGAGHQWL